MLRTIIALEQDGLDIRVLALNFEVPSVNFNLKAAVRAACAEYCQTEAGKATYHYNCNSFNWADFAMSVPADICEKHGFKVIQSDVADEIVNWDEELVDDIDDECDDCEGCDGTECDCGNYDCLGCDGGCAGNPAIGCKGCC